MRRIMVGLLALVMLFSCAAFAESSSEATWMIYDFGGFNMAFPQDIVGSFVEEKAENQIFLQIFQDYDENKFFIKNLNCVWSSGALDITTVDPEFYANIVIEALAGGFKNAGLGVNGYEVLYASLDEHEGEPCMFMILSTTLDYTSMGGPSEMTLYTIQTQFSGEDIGGTYTFTISTDDLENTQLLMGVMDTICWNK